MKNKAVLRTINELSFAGEVCFGKFINEGVCLKPSPKSNFKIWCPLNEIKCFILPSGKIIEGNEILKIFSYLAEQLEFIPCEV